MASQRAYSLLFRQSLLQVPTLSRSIRDIRYARRPHSPTDIPVAYRSVSTDPSSSTTITPEAPDYLSDAELQIFNKLKAEFEPSKLEVQDISGGCGSMYGLDIVSPRFAGLTVIKQHKLVNAVLAEEIKKWHGVQLKTKAP